MAIQSPLIIYSPTMSAQHSFNTSSPTMACSSWGKENATFTAALYDHLCHFAVFLVYPLGVWYARRYAELIGECILNFYDGIPGVRNASINHATDPEKADLIVFTDHDANVSSANSDANTSRRPPTHTSNCPFRQWEAGITSDLKDWPCAGCRRQQNLSVPLSGLFWYLVMLMVGWLVGVIEGPCWVS